MFNLQVQCQYYMPDNFDLLNTFLPLSLGVPCQGLFCNVWLAFPSECPIQLYLYVLMVTSSGCCLVLFHKSSICCLYGIEPPHFNISVSQRPWLRSRMMTFLYTGFSSYRETFFMLMLNVIWTLCLFSMPCFSTLVFRKTKAYRAFVFLPKMSSF